MPEGLLNRGKYCGKSKLRVRMNEFGEDTKSKARSVNTLTRR